MATAAIPIAMSAGSAIYNHFKNKKANAAQSTAMAQTQQSGADVSKLSAPLMQQGSALAGQGAGLLQQGAGQLGQAGNYYGNILSNRRAASESLAPEMTTALDYYKGAERKTARTMRGGARDYAQAELGRQKVGQMAGMLPAARASAAQGMTNVGSATGNLGSSAIYGGGSMTGQGVNAATSGASINNSLFQQGQTTRQNNADSGKGWGSMLFDVIGGIAKSKAGGTSGVPGTKPGVPWP